MILANFADVHPNWNVVRQFDAIETRAVLEILIMATLLDGQLTPSERELLIDEYAHLPVGRTSIDPEIVERMFEVTSERLAEIRRDPEQFATYLDRICAGITTAPKGEAALRLLAMLCVADGVTEEEFEFCRAVGHRFGLSRDTIDEILRHAWETRQDYLVEHVPGVRRAMRLVTGAHFFEDRPANPSNFPFQQRETA
jgi:hypothetical protein